MSSIESLPARNIQDQRKTVEDKKSASSEKIDQKSKENQENGLPATSLGGEKSAETQGQDRRKLVTV